MKSYTSANKYSKILRFTIILYLTSCMKYITLGTNFKDPFAKFIIHQIKSLKTVTPRLAKGQFVYSGRGGGFAYSLRGQYLRYECPKTRPHSRIIILMKAAHKAALQLEIEFRLLSATIQPSFCQKLESLCRLIHKTLPNLSISCRPVLLYILSRGRRRPPLLLLIRVVAQVCFDISWCSIVILSSLLGLKTTNRFIRGQTVLIKQEK